MLSRQDYLGYLNQMREVEKVMKDFYFEKAQIIDTPQIKVIIENLANDEAKHESIVCSLQKLINEKYPAQE